LRTFAHRRGQAMPVIGRFGIGADHLNCLASHTRSTASRTQPNPAFSTISSSRLTIARSSIIAGDPSSKYAAIITPVLFVRNQHNWAMRMSVQDVCLLTTYGICLFVVCLFAQLCRAVYASF